MMRTGLSDMEYTGFSSGQRTTREISGTFVDLNTSRTVE